MHYVTVGQLLILLTLANSSPVIAKRILGGAYAIPIDGNIRFLDGRPLLGPSKTIRGIVVSLRYRTRRTIDRSSTEIGLLVAAMP
jgi:CDP-2,3-bis-(O-geranylgeranyl)-sn-glycerol synthase